MTSGALTGAAERSLIYSHPTLYGLVMRVLYGAAYEARYRAINELIADGADVFEACAGDAYLYRRYLRQRAVRYRSGEFNPNFVSHARARGIQMDRFDLRSDPVPVADVVILHASLYQFMPDHLQVVERLLRSARQTLIISEPVRNLSTSDWALVRWIATRSADPGDGNKPARFDEASLDDFFERHYAPRITARALIPGGREKIFCLRGLALGVE